MKRWMSLVILLSFMPTVWAQTNAYLEESIYYSFKKAINNPSKKLKSFAGVTAFDQSLFVDALWDSVEDGSENAQEFLLELQPIHYGIYERLRLSILRLKFHKNYKIPKSQINELTLLLSGPQVEDRIIYMIETYDDLLIKRGYANIVELARARKDIDTDPDKDTGPLVSDIFNNSPNTVNYSNGEYRDAVKIFMFCRTNRLYPCLMLMRDANGDAKRNADGSLWTHKSLASSKHGFPSNQRNGQTPTGVYTIDSVMPVADEQISYGKNRRMILNFISKTKNEARLLSLLPESSRTEKWWKESVVARDMGRNLFRIHGSGHINEDPTSTWFPFIRTSGCVAQRENTYGNTTYNDQRELLDTIMETMNLNTVYENELKVKGFLYIVEINDVNASVEADDLKKLGIE